MRSLRQALVVGTTGGMVVVLCVAGVLLYFIARASLVNQFDRALADKAVLVAASVERKAARVAFEPEDLNMEEFQAANGPAYLQLSLSDGSTLFKSPSLRKSDIAPVSAEVDSPAFRWVKLPNGHFGREVAFVFTPHVDEEGGEPNNADEAASRGYPDTVTLALARDTAPIATTLSRLETLLLGCGLGTIIVSAGLLWTIIRRALRPLDNVAAEISSIGPQDLSAKIEMCDVPVELQSVVERLNDLLGRLCAAFERERSFSADVAHELRTPLAGLRSTLEVTVARPRPSVEYEAALNECLQVTIQMQAMVENLLTLARLDSGEIKVKPERILLDELIREVNKPLVQDFAARGLQVQGDLAPQLAIDSDPSLLSLIIRNLLDNALAYTDKGGGIRLEARERGDVIRMQVCNSGSKVREDQVEHLFQRFWRADAARSTTGLHCGLGLSLVKRIVCLLGGSVSAYSSFGSEFRITISIPKTYSAPAGRHRLSTPEELLPSEE